MPYLRNPGGRIVAVETEQQYKDLLTKPGFLALNAKEEKAHIAQRYTLVQSMQKPHEDPNKINLYLSTVSQGGKDGYGIASKHLIDELRQIDVNVQTFTNKQK